MSARCSSSDWFSGELNQSVSIPANQSVFTGQKDLLSLQLLKNKIILVIMFGDFMLKLCQQLLQQSGVLSLLSPPGGRQEKLKIKSFLQSPETIHRINSQSLREGLSKGSIMSSFKFASAVSIK